MNWVEGLCLLCEQRSGALSDEMKGKIIQNEAAVVNVDPCMILYRHSSSRRPKTFPSVSNGNGTYDATGAWAMDAMGVSSDVIYIDDDFYTAVQSELTLPEQVTLKMTGKKPGLFSGLRKKDLDHWTVKGTCGSEAAEQIAPIVQAIDPNHKHFYEISLLPNDDPQRHTLIVRTNKIPWEIDSFNSVSDYFATDADGRRLKSRDAAILCMDNLVKISIECHRVMGEQTGN